MYIYLKIKKKNKIVIQRYIRKSIQKKVTKKKIMFYILKNKKISDVTRFFYFLKNKRSYKRKKYYVKKPIKNICPYSGKTYTNMKLGFSRFYLQYLTNKSKLNLFRSY